MFVKGIFVVLVTCCTVSCRCSGPLWPPWQACGGAELLSALEKLLEHAGGRPSPDLRPEIASMCETWKVSQMEARSVGLERMSASAQQVLQRAMDAGNLSDISRLQAEIQEAWRHEVVAQGVQSSSGVAQARATVGGACWRAYATNSIILAVP